MSEKIQYFQEDIEIRLPDFFYQKVPEWLTSVIKKEGKSTGNINLILCSDNYILNVNKKYLNHDYFTDIITFNYNEENYISGDLFISIDTVSSNAEKLSLPVYEELKRIIIHGVLHLLGYNDKTPEQIKEIRSKEDFYLTLLSEKI